ncbi:unnamed protein product [Ambrosiozyma monospora]|uniref:Unnamed protein product n=1 Tax=Ambrosiozyma monospora TaxID=43982 RepID=A0A9W6YUA9_AMBMO|nr:unnamed protein product [Ambrosiozyma monospora]
MKSIVARIANANENDKGSRDFGTAEVEEMLTEEAESAILDSGAEISITSNAAILQCYKCNGTFVSEAELIPLGVNFRRRGKTRCLFFGEGFTKSVHLVQVGKSPVVPDELIVTASHVSVATIKICSVHTRFYL